MKPSLSCESDHKIRIIIADDHQMIRKGLKKIIESENDFLVIAEASNGMEAVKLNSELSPDIILMDVNMPDMDGIEATRIITSGLTDVRIIGLSLHGREQVARELKRAGATAYLSKTDVFETLSETIRHQVHDKSGEGKDKLSP